MSLFTLSHQLVVAGEGENTKISVPLQPVGLGVRSGRASHGLAPDDFLLRGWTGNSQKPPFRSNHDLLGDQLSLERRIWIPTRTRSGSWIRQLRRRRTCSLSLLLRALV